MLRAISQNTYQIANPLKLRRLFVLFMYAVLFLGVVIAAKPFKVKEPQVLLLNSGLTDIQEAELRVVLWFESDTPSREFKNSLPQEGWEWREAEQRLLNSHTYTLSGYKRIHSREEKELYVWFQGLSKEVKELGGQAYFDERISQGIDISSYAVKQGIYPVQWSLSESTLSVTGRSSSDYPWVKAGEDFVNIQLISQAYDGQGKTALAIPVLLEEF